jgi:hypothetical protein
VDVTLTLKRNPNVSGQAYGFQAITPIVATEVDALRAYLHGLRADGRRSPLARLPRTHMARWVILDDFVTDPAWKQPHADHLVVPYLVFTSNFDGPLDTYLDELVSALAPEAPQIWGRCIGCPPGGGAELKAYLMHNQIDCGLFYAAYGKASVAKVKAALDARTRMIDFAVRSQGLSPEARQAAFRSEFGV